MERRTPESSREATDQGSEAATGVAQRTNELAQTFFALLTRHRSYFQGVVGELGISVTQVHIMQFLSDGPMTMRELAIKSCCEPSNLTGVIDKLQAKRFVSRRADRKDRRIKLVSLTRTGKTFRDKLMARFGEPAPWMAQLSAEDQRQLIAILQRAIVLATPLEKGSP